MKSGNLALIGALSLAGTALAQVPSTNDTSTTAGANGKWNTGMGTGALGGPTAVNLTGKSNTASGYNVLYYNTSGSFNTASGADALLSNTTGSYNTASGYYALNSNTTAEQNTAIGAYALTSNTTGAENTALGSDALLSNTTGQDNTASGVDALYYNTTGSYNTGFGVQTLYLNTTGGGNTALGESALYSNTSGDANTASGFNALQFNTTGSFNVAAGENALSSNTTGSYNTASGYYALNSNTIAEQNTAFGSYALTSNTTGQNNTASGVDALYYNTTGSGNTALGEIALYWNTTGNNNIAEGYLAGSNLTIGSYNIDIGNIGVAADSGVMRIGTPGQQTQTFIAGISNSIVTGAQVIVNPSTGQLGVLASSERFKTAIAPMGSNTSKLGQLRPVIFKLKGDATGTRQYGLIAEEVAKVYPELAIRDSKGRIDGVRYDELAPMLLNEVQKQQGETAAQVDKIAALGEQNAALHMEIRDLKRQVAELNDLKQEMRAALRQLESTNQFVTQR
jgi:hypothetical protein